MIGVTGELGGAVASELAGRDDVSVRAFVRRPLPPDGPRVDEIVEGDLRDVTSLDRACAGVASMFLVSSPTHDQVDLLTHDNVVRGGAKTLADLGIAATAAEAILPTYLDRFRIGGRYNKHAPA